MSAFFSAPRPTAQDDDSDSCDDEYEYVEDPDKKKNIPSPVHHTDARQPAPLPQDPSMRPKLAPPTAPKKNKKPPPIPSSKPVSPLSQKSPQTLQQDVLYEVQDDEISKDRPRLPAPIEEDVYEPVEPNDDVYECTDLEEMGRAPAPIISQKPVIDDGEVYQNEPISMKHKDMSGRYRNLPADRGQISQVGKDGGYTKFSSKR